jgi:hypothetical protein
MDTQSTKDPDKIAQAYQQARDVSGKFSKLDPPLVSFSVTNPVTYLKRWWKGVMAGEGVDLKLKIHPLTAVMIVLAIGGVSFGIGRISIPPPIIKYIPILATPAPVVVPTPNPWHEAAFWGTLQRQNNQFYLISSDAQAIVLEVPNTVDLAKYVGKKILASGLYNQGTSVLQVSAASDLELISGSQPVATVPPTSVPTQTPAPTPTVAPTPNVSL